MINRTGHYKEQNLFAILDLIIPKSYIQPCVRVFASGDGMTAATWQEDNSRAQSLEYLNLEGRLANMNLGVTSGGARPKTALLNRYNRCVVVHCVLHYSLCVQ